MSTNGFGPRIYKTTSTGLDRKSFPMRLWHRAKVHGVWNPEDFDFSQDRRDWLGLNPSQQERILQLCALFQAGEEAVTLDLLPLIHVIASEGRIEEEMFLTSFLWEEAKHVDLFSRFFAEVTGPAGDLSRYFYRSYQRMFDVELRGSLDRLRNDSSVEAQIRASTTYNMVVEGVMAETGYYLFSRMLNENGIMPAMQKAVILLQRDESRHIAFGVYLLSRLIVEHGDRAFHAFMTRMGELQPLIEEGNREFMGAFQDHAFGVQLDEIMAFSMRQFTNRMNRITTARTQTLEDLRAVDGFYQETVEA